MGSFRSPLGGGRLGKLALCRSGIDGLVVGSGGFDQLKKSAGKKNVNIMAKCLQIWIVGFCIYIYIHVHI